MIKQPDYGEVSFIFGDSKNIELLNKVLGDIELTEGEEKSPVW